MSSRKFIFVRKNLDKELLPPTNLLPEMGNFGIFSEFFSTPGGGNLGLIPSQGLGLSEAAEEHGMCWKWHKKKGGFISGLGFAA